MKKNYTRQNDILDILFANRNKEYGAYELRIHYHQRMKYAVGGMLLICLLFFAGSILAKSGNGDRSEQLFVKDLELEKFDQEIKEPPPVQPPPKVEQPPKVATEIFTVPKIEKDNLVEEEDMMKEVEALEKVQIATFRQEGDDFDGTVVVPPVEKETGISKQLNKDVPDYEEIFRVVQIPAAFPGGIDSWRRYLERKLNRDLPSENGAPVGRYSVLVTFVVDEAGRVSEVQAENDPGYGTKIEAIRVIQNGPNWTPAIQNGRKVKYRHKQTIVFEVADN